MASKLRTVVRVAPYFIIGVVVLSGTIISYSRSASSTAPNRRQGSSSASTAESVAYQIEPAHSGSQSDAITPPLAPRWSRDLGGPVSYPLIVKGRIFVIVQNPTSYGTQLYALDETTGATLWGPFSLGGTYNFGGIAYENGRVFALNYDGLLRAFDATSGNVIWSKQLVGQYSFTSPPTALGAIVYRQPEQVARCTPYPSKTGRSCGRDL